MAIPLDNRFPHLIRVSDVELPHVRREAIVAQRQIVNRTNIGCCYDTNRAGLYFYLPHDIRCGLGIDLPLEEDGRVIRPSASDIDDIVRLIGMSRLPAEEKDRIAASNAQKEEWKAQDEMNTHLAERRPDALQRAEHLRTKRQMGKHFRKGAVVNGLKGA